MAREMMLWPIFQLGHSLDPGDRGDIPVVQPVAGMEGHSQATDQRTGLDQSGKFAAGFFRGRCIGIASGMQFDGHHTEIGRGPNLIDARVDEEADFHPRPLAARDSVEHSGTLTDHVEPAFGRQLGSTFGDERDLDRPKFHCDRHDGGLDG